MDNYDQVCTQILFSDVALGMTFATVAGNQTDKARYTRLVDRAWRVHDSILCARYSIAMSREEQSSLECTLRELGDFLRWLDSHSPCSGAVQC